MSEQTPSIRSIIRCGGGPKEISAAAKRLGISLAAKTVYRWAEIGIPEKHWRVVMSVCGVTEATLHKANEALRTASRPRRAA